MNLVQIMRKARQGVDAILPGGLASAQWTDEEMVDLVNEAYENLQREFRLVNSKWMLQTINTSTTAFFRDGETYTPSTALVLSSTNYKITLPPDFAEMVRVRCTNDRTLRFVPAQAETYHWIDEEENSYDAVGTLVNPPTQYRTFFYDLVGNRTLYVIPVQSGTYNLEIDYIPMKRPLYFTNRGTVSITNGTTTITGTGTTFVDDSILSESTDNAAELIVNVSDPQSNQISLAKDYPRVATITTNTAATLKANFAPATVTDVPFILTMSPALPREYHRWLCRLTSALMLSKINPEISDKYSVRYTEQFQTQINPVARRRQSQDSRITEDAEEMGLGGDF